MLKLLATTILVIFLSISDGISQADFTSKATAMTASIDQQVRLNATQKQAIDDINMVYLTQVDNLDDSNLADGIFYAQRKSLNAKRIEDIRGLLTAGQLRRLKISK